MKIGVLECEDNPVWNYTELWRLALGQQDGDEWITYRVAAKAEVPTLSDGLDVAIITGSHYNVRDAKPWMAPLGEFIRSCSPAARPSGASPAMSNDGPAVKLPRVIGGCFGAQIIAAALGGAVDYNPGKKFLLKAEEVVPTPAFDEWLTQSCGCKLEAACTNATSTSSDVSTGTGTGAGSAVACCGRAFRMLVSHGDCVSVLPPDSTLLASSASCAAEAYCVGDNILAFQSHPEFDVAGCIMSRIWPWSVVQRRRLSAASEAAALESFKRPLDSAAFLDILNRYMRAGLRSA
jgi:GMP synthase-like glutamine amidotransferase